MKTSPGLGAAEAAERLRQDGPNVLPQVRPVPRWRRFAAEFTHFFALMLWAAAALSFIAGMPQLGVAVLVVIVVNGVFAYVQESRAERAAVQLRALLPSRVKVRRDGAVREVDVSELVRGDAVLLAAGSRIPADVVFQAADAVTVDESMLSGESEPVPKQAEDTGFGGTFLVNGTAECGVTATGAGTRLAAIATLTSAAHPPSSPLNNELRRVVRMISVAALVLGGLFFAVSLVTGMSWRNAFLFAIGVSVAMVPEGLLPTVTLSLAMGAQQMARRRALVRHLQAVETLGSTTYICTDKTGTLTQNRMSAVEVWTPAGTVTVRGTGYEPDGEAAGTREARRRAEVLAAAARTASEGGIRLREGTWTAEGDPMDAALEVLARRLALGTLPRRGPNTGGPSTRSGSGYRQSRAQNCPSRAPRKAFFPCAPRTPTGTPVPGHWTTWPAGDCASWRWRGERCRSLPVAGGRRTPLPWNGTWN